LFKKIPLLLLTLGLALSGVLIVINGLTGGFTAGAAELIEDSVVNDDAVEAIVSDDETVKNDDEYVIEEEIVEAPEFDLSGEIAADIDDELYHISIPPAGPQIDYLDNPVTMYAVRDSNVRSGPSTDHARVGGLAFRNSVEIIGESNGWWVTADGNFISGELLSDTQPPAPAPRPAAPARSSGGGGTTTDSQGRTIRWRTWWANTGEQAEISACTGGLTLHQSMTNIVGYHYFALHRTCGGYRQLQLNIGDYIMIGDVTLQVIGEKFGHSGWHDDLSPYQRHNTGWDAAIQTTMPPTGSGFNRIIGLRELWD